jgi:CubicO group peptidase (beta-lactamase class C family)
MAAGAEGGPSEEDSMPRTGPKLPPVLLAALPALVVLLPSSSTAAPPGGLHTERPGTSRADVTTGEHWAAHYPRRVRAAGDVEPAGEPERLLRRFFNLHSAMRYDEALPVAEALVQSAPERPIAEYNLACVLARLQRTDQAMGALARAVDCGWRGGAHMRIDPDLEGLRGDERFRSELERIERLVEAERIEPGPLRDEPWEQVAAELAERVPGLLERYHVPGATVALVRDGACVWTGGFGMVDRGTAEPVDTDTVFPVAAPGHLLALMAAAQLDGTGRLDLDELLTNGEALARRRDPWREAGRTSGAATRGEWRVGRSGSASRAFRRAGSAPSVPRQVVSDLPAGPALSRWPASAGSRETARLVRLAVEVAGGSTFPEYCREHLLGPLAFDATVLATRADAPPDACTGHTLLGSPVGPAAPDQHPPRSASRSAMLTYTTAHDMARLVACLLETPNAGGGDRVLSEDGRAALLDAMDRELGRLGLGVQAAPTGCGPRVQVADVTAGVGCLIRWYPEGRCGVVVLFNSETGPPAALRIAALALGGA